MTPATLATYESHLRDIILARGRHRDPRDRNLARLALIRRARWYGSWAGIAQATGTDVAAVQEEAGVLGVVEAVECAIAEATRATRAA